MTHTSTSPQAELAARSIDHAIRAVTDTLVRTALMPNCSDRASRWYFTLRAGLAYLLWAQDRVRRGRSSAPFDGAGGDILRLSLLALRSNALVRQAALGKHACEDPTWQELRAAIAFFEGVVGDRKPRSVLAAPIGGVHGTVALAGAQG
jgi:hypothetical protein